LPDPSGLAITFQLRPNVRWHDGLPFTSSDVAFSLMTLKQVHPRGRSTFANVSEVQTPDPLTAIVRLSRPAPALIYALAGAESPMLPGHRYENRDPLSSVNETAPIGTGPYIFREWVKGSHVALDRNPSYWSNPLPRVGGLLMRFIGKAAERVAAIENGSIDIAPGTPVPVADLKRLSRAQDLLFEKRLSRAQDLLFETNGYEYTNQIVRLEFNLDHPILGKYEVRRAIAHAIDRANLVAMAWDGTARWR
jgi:peptide/nickel transport system substrate-binding protein